jgi:hypothetical protein
MSTAESELSFATQLMRGQYLTAPRGVYTRANRNGHILVSALVTDVQVAYSAAKVEEIFRSGANSLAAEGETNRAKRLIFAGHAKQLAYLERFHMAERVIERRGFGGTDDLAELQEKADAIMRGELSVDPAEVNHVPEHTRRRVAVTSQPDPTYL